MILMFNKKDFTGKWFFDGEDTTGYTEKIPKNTRCVFDEEIDDWKIIEFIADNNEEQSEASTEPIDQGTETEPENPDTNTNNEEDIIDGN